jgi:NAD-dependent SIR2 family protein deacetylase
MDAVVQAARIVAQADALVIAAGAGMGVDSGLPDFRGNAGFWKAYPALAASDTGFMDIASPAAFLADPRRAWGFYGHRLALYRRAVPHAGYGLLRRWAAAMEHGCFVFTSNVDGHFSKAGFDPGHIAECHGSIHALQCMQPCRKAVWPADAFIPVVDEARCELLGPMPSCPHCGGIARPNILMFHDSDWIAERYDRQAARLHAWLEQVRRPVVVELGAGMHIRTVRSFAQRTVLQHQGSLIRINPRDAETGTLPGVGLAAGALQALEAIDRLLNTERMSDGEPGLA